MPRITLPDPSLKSKKFDLTPRVKTLKKAYFRAIPEVCVERPLSVTVESRARGLFDKDKISILDKARLYRKVLEEKEPIITQRIAFEKGKGRSKPKRFAINADSLFAGATTTKFKGVPLYPEFMAMTLWPELWNISTRKNNPFYLDKKDAEILNFEVFPHWMDSNINELARMSSYGEHDGYDSPEMDLMELLVFFIDTKPNYISHTIPDMTTPIKDGLRKIINRAKRKRRTATKPKFYDALVEVLEGIITYSNNLADEAERLASLEKDKSRKKELTALA
ncbi:MAG: pyruvate formate lyase family protein, partial [Thermodesulfobacteriota bacterium]